MKTLSLALLAPALFATSAFAAVEVTCVCTKYSLNSESKVFLEVQEVYKTTQMKRVNQCNDSKDVEVRDPELTKAHFNCRPVAKEDLAKS
jgi:hypothetical protein